MAEDPECAEIGNALHLRHFAQCGSREPLERCQIRADDLYGISAFDARQSFLDVVLNILREIEIDADELLVEFVLQIVDQLVLGVAARPFVKGLQRHEELGVEESRRIAAIVRPAMLGNDRHNFGMAKENFADFVDDGHAGFERYCRRHGRAYP